MRVSGCDGEAANEWLQVREPFHKKHRFGAERAAKLAALRWLLWWRDGVEQRTAAEERGGSSAVGEEPEVADADQAPRQHVDEEAPQELVG